MPATEISGIVVLKVFLQYSQTSIRAYVSVCQLPFLLKKLKFSELSFSRCVFNCPLLNSASVKYVFFGGGGFAVHDVLVRAAFASNKVHVTFKCLVEMGKLFPLAATTTTTTNSLLLRVGVHLLSKTVCHYLPPFSSLFSQKRK